MELVKKQTNHVSKLLKREMNMDQAGDELIKTTVRAASGRLTCAEVLGHKEFIMTKLFRSAYAFLVFCIRLEKNFLIIAAPTPRPNAKTIENIPYKKGWSLDKSLTNSAIGPKVLTPLS